MSANTFRDFLHEAAAFIDNDDRFLGWITVRKRDIEIRQTLRDTKLWKTTMFSWSEIENGKTNVLLIAIKYDRDALLYKSKKDLTSPAA